MHARLVRAALVTALAALSACVGPAALAVPTAAPDGDVTWTVRTGTHDLGADRTSFTYTVNPGGSVEDTLVVANHGATALDLAIHTADGYTTESGQLDLLTPEETSTGVGAWVASSTSTVTVQPDATVDVPFTVQVPDSATPGDYVGGIVTSLTQADTEEGINVDRRLGVRITLHVGGEVQPSLAVEGVAVAYHGTLNPFSAGDATISYTLHNTGNTTVSAQQVASAGGPFGWFTVHASDLEATPQLLPGESWKVSVPLHHVTPAVRVSATAVVTPLLTDAAGSTTSLDQESASASTWAIPWSLLVLVLAMVAAVLGTVRVLRRRKRARTAREAVRVQEAVDQALRERATTSAS
ncbi:WxL protein peptidoglycan domain-containing protein [Cellulomonas sp. URHE0023]|uniref:WxL protein peptidoglycan domain-containing protein n=1 Tax=Cellulomonas sp. URHE0023 TaxID=1380354 RepID=UPI000489C8CA|nr:DUF916 domain-containing protein [Cellulomonas sp. URHE0023]